MDSRLVRPTSDRMIAGVCSGLSRYFNVDVTIVRLVFVAAVFFGGVSPLIYVLLWIVMPESYSAAQAQSQPQPPVFGQPVQQQPTQDPTGEWQYDPYTGERIKREDQNL